MCLGGLSAGVPQTKLPWTRGTTLSEARRSACVNSGPCSVRGEVYPGVVRSKKELYMARGSLLDEIERDALDSKVRIADVLRKCVALGGQANSEELRDWASRELRGYSRDDELPEYRKIGAPIGVDAMKGPGIIKGQRFAASALPDFVQEEVSEEFPLLNPIGEVEEIATRFTEKDDTVHFSLPMAAEIASYMNQKIGDPFQHIENLYWMVSPSVLFGVVDQVRTTLVELVAELRSTMPKDQEIPTPEAAANAVQVAVHGGKRHKVMVAAPQAPASVAMNTETASENGGWWTPARKVGAALVGLATITGTVILLIQWLGE